MDEFFVFIDLEQFSNQNPAAFRLSGSCEDKPVFTVILSALSDGTFLPPLLFYKGTPSHVPEGFPDNILLEARPEGFTDQDCHRAWINRVCVTRETALLCGLFGYVMPCLPVCRCGIPVSSLSRSLC